MPDPSEATCEMDIFDGVESDVFKNPPRFVWPKQFPALTAKQRRISDDWMHYWHSVLPGRYNSIEKFNHTYPLRFAPNGLPKARTLDVGAGSGGQILFESMDNQDYHCLELRENMAAELQRKFPQVTVTVGNCEDRTPYEDAYFDRVLAIHVLEHIRDLPSAVKEIHRMLRPGGLFSIVIPSDPGAAYWLARKISSDRMFRNRYKTSYDWFIRREHINSPKEIRFVLKKAGFTEIDSAYYPFNIPVANINLCIGMTMQKPIR